MSDVQIPTRTWTILAQDPSVTKRDGRPLLTKLEVPAEDLIPGPRGHRVSIIDHDPVTGIFYKPRRGRQDQDPWADHDRQTVHKLVEDPHFHAQNVYAIVMATLMHFERALGRNVPWAFPSGSPQIKVAPHGLAEANAFYSRRDEALVFGYFPSPDWNGRGRPRVIFTCLSHDIIAHETTHALIDALRPEYFWPTSPDQAAFHEGFSDIVALLSIFRQEEVVRHRLADLTPGLRLGL